MHEPKNLSACMHQLGALYYTLALLLNDVLFCRQKSLELALGCKACRLF